MGDIAVALPAIAFERLCAHHHRLDRLFMAVDAVPLNDLLRMFVRADHLGRLSRAEHIHIMHALPSLFDVIVHDVIMRQVAVRTFRPRLVRAMSLRFGLSGALLRTFLDSSQIGALDPAQVGLPQNLILEVGFPFEYDQRIALQQKQRNGGNVYDVVGSFLDKGLQIRPGTPAEWIRIRIRVADAGQSIQSLSGGNQQKALVGRWMEHPPRVLILDEPTIGLDPTQIIEVRSLIQELGMERTILLSTHILSEAQQICNRVLIINKGHIVAEDSPERLQARLSGAQRVTVKVKGDTDDLASVIASTPGVTLVLPHPNGELEFETALGEDIRAHVAKSIVSAGFDLLEFHTISLSLEDIFLQLIREEEATSLDVISTSRSEEGIKYA